MKSDRTSRQASTSDTSPGRSHLLLEALMGALRGLKTGDDQEARRFVDLIDGMFVDLEHGQRQQLASIEHHAHLLRELEQRQRTLEQLLEVHTDDTTTRLRFALDRWVNAIGEVIDPTDDSIDGGSRSPV